MFLAFLMVFSLAPTLATQARELTPYNTRFSIYSNDPATTVGDGVNVITGVFSRSVTDLELSMGQGLRFSRFYHTQNTENTVDPALDTLGTGWRHNFMFSLTTSGNTVTSP